MAKPEIIQWVEENTGITECSFYQTMGYEAYRAAFYSFFTGQFWLTGGLALVGRAAELTAEAAGCNKPAPPPAGSDNCWKVATCEDIWTLNGSTWYVYGIQGTEILSFTTTPVDENRVSAVLQYINCEGVETTYNYPVLLFNGAQVAFRNVPCEGKEPAPPPEPLPPGTPIADPVTHTTSDECNWTIQAFDAYVDDAGVWHTYYTITADNDACGGPFAYWSSGDKPPEFVTPPGDDDEGQPYPPPPPPNYNSQNCCKEIQEELDKIKTELDAIKQCACGDPKPELLGDWISIRFVSDGISPGGTNPLRKLFRYRSQSSRTDEQLREYWAGFTWQAGPVIVQHKGTWWGTPQVWASSAEEGKRVLRFAAGEAGATPDTDGEWIVTGSASARYGMPGTMRIQQYRGRDWVTSRLGPSGPVEL